MSVFKVRATTTAQMDTCTMIQQGGTFMMEDAALLFHPQSK